MKYGKMGIKITVSIRSFQKLTKFQIHLIGAATNPWIRFEADFDPESAVSNVSAIH